MDELEPLATALRQALGAPPESWQATQRARLREHWGRAPRRALVQWAPWAVAAFAAAGLALWFFVLRVPAGVEHWLVAEELGRPFRLDDGSSISLAPGGRGRLFTERTAVRFDLHQGRADFDVIPGGPRTWTVSAGKNEVRVVGTRFSVYYGAGEAFEVEVERGMVSVRVPERKASVELAMGDRLRGGPGRLEVAHGTAKTPAATPTALKSAGGDEGSAPPAATSVRAEPSASVAAADWQARYREGKYADALALVRASGVIKRLNELSASSLSELADAARLGGDAELAVRALTTLLQRFPNAPEARDGRFLLGRVHALRGDRAAAIDALESYLGSGASALYANEALGRLMEMYSARGDGERAREMARRYLERAPNGPYHRLARSLLDGQR